MLSFSFDDFMEAGGMAGLERRAAEQAIRGEREIWLPILEAYQATLSHNDALWAVIVDAEIRRLRRAAADLGRGTSAASPTDTRAGTALPPATKDGAALSDVWPASRKDRPGQARDHA